MRIHELLAPKLPPPKILLSLPNLNANLLLFKMVKRVKSNRKFGLISAKLRANLYLSCFDRSLVTIYNYIYQFGL